MSIEGYFRRDGRYVAFEAVALGPGGPLVAAGSGPAAEVGNLGTLRASLVVRRVPGAGATLDVALETSFDGATGWRPLGAFAQATAAGHERKSFPGCDRFVRATFALGALPAAGTRVGAVVGSGTSPPAVTLTGAPTSLAAFHVRLEVTTAGAVGAMHFRYTLDGGQTYIADVPGAAAVALGTSGLTADFPAGAYTLDQAFDADVAPAPAFECAIPGEAV